MKTNRQTFRQILQYLKPYWFLLILTILLAAAGVVLSLYVPVLTGKAVDCIIDPGNVDFSNLLPILVLIGIVVVAAAVSQWLMNLCNNRITYHVVKDIRTEAFAHLHKLPLRHMDTRPHGDTVSRLINDVDQFSDGLLMGFSQLFTGVVTILGTLLFMLSVNWEIALLVVVITPLSLFVASFIAKRTYSLFRLQSETRAEMTSLVNEMVGNQKVVKAFGYEEEAEARMDTINERLRGLSIRATFFSSITNPATRFVNGLVYTGVGIIGALFAITGRITVGQLVSFLSYANQYTKPFNEISAVITEFQNALASAQRVFDFMEEPEQVPDAADAVQLADVNGTVDLQKVSFAYRPDEPLLQNISLSVKAGQRIAIVGPTGSGKTTLINLLMRFYDVDSGQILVSGHEIRKVTRDSLRASFGMVLQETWLKTGTIRENIAYGSPEATQAQIVEAAKAAHAHSFIKRMPEGYDTHILEDGGNLSQGQIQLICIARVMLRLPPMLILDEATSSIDTRTEIMVQRAFTKMMQGRTSFVVAHRLSTIREADVILVMKDGNIIEQGNHQQLLEQKGFYAELFNSQFAVAP
ncbi:ABC transporter ATP-binding protein [Candidatus Dojkabacteria bacterium]|uniref:ABC transporter ATP-binding protein n=1 Tax=Candidatus Dojkabacteria bacterium TaxID=2099670 RepID=A0A847EUP0_9BACT|nr:ABC transporter ATP-binding protein [Candidatus Dojkabacteria bacterium]